MKRPLCAMLLGPLLTLSLVGCDPGKGGNQGHVGRVDDSGADDGGAVEGDDSDGDGYDADEDCDDSDATISPGAAELCNGLDDDCDGEVDEDSASDATTWYADTDGDGYGDADSATVSCEQPVDTVANADDCDDSDEDLNPDTVWYIDYDGDGHGDDAFILAQCSQPSGYVDTLSDCDDTDPAIHPDAIEVCNGLDDDCDGDIDDDDADLDTTTVTTWYEDVDGDGFGDADSATDACDAAGHVDNADDCDDTDADVNPDADEDWFDTVDSDCDGAEDPDACEDAPAESTVTIDTTCTYASSSSAFNPVIEWEMPTFVDYAHHDHIVMTPVVGQLTDDNGDGDIDDDDTPDIVVVSNPRTGNGGTLRAISGDGTSVHSSTYSYTWDSDTYFFYRWSGAAIADVDNDGEAEILAIAYHRTDGCFLGAWDVDGNVEWVYTGHSLGCRNHAPAVADLDGDGDVEVIAGHVIVNGADGSLRGAGTGGRGYYSSYSNSGYHSFGVDLDGDGVQEVLAGSSVYDADGAELCSTGYTDGYPAAADLDGDGYGEFVVSGNGYVRVFEDDCTYIAGWSVYGGGYGGPPTIADFDGDGTPEIAVAGMYYYTVYESDGTVLWANSDITDVSSHSTGSSVFDFDGDGAAEVVYADEEALWVFDGASGTTILEDTTHRSGTINEYPVIADVDGDGKAEIVIANDNQAVGLYVLGDANDEWVSARMVWNQHAYSITNINDDLSVPAAPDSNWPDFNSFRQGAPSSADAQGAGNVYPVAYDACQAACGDDVEVLVQIANDGVIRADDALVLGIYGEDSGGTRTRIDGSLFAVDVDSGQLTAPYSFTFAASEVALYSTLVAVVDDEEASNECDEGDNEAEIDISLVCE
jgi:hypothetical protein